MGSLGGSFLNGQNAVKKKWMFLSMSPNRRSKSMLEIIERKETSEQILHAEENNTRRQTVRAISQSKSLKRQLCDIS